MTVPGSGAAEVELFDTVGRLIVRRRYGALSSGTRTERLEGPASLAPGVYVLRLTQGGRAASTRIVVTR